MNSQLYVQYIACEALQMASEAFLVGVLEDAHLAALHARRITVLRKDMDLIRRIRGRYDPIFAETDQYRVADWRKK